MLAPASQDYLDVHSPSIVTFGHVAPGCFMTFSCFCIDGGLGVQRSLRDSWCGANLKAANGQGASSGLSVK